MTLERDTMHKLFAAALLGLVATTAQAELMAPAPPVVVRGTIDSVTGNVLGVTSKTGEKLTVVLAWINELVHFSGGWAEAD